MGQTQSLSPQELEELSKGTTFTSDEIRRLYTGFQKLDKDGNGMISKNEFKEIPELVDNPLLSRVISVFDKNGDGSVDFQEFISLIEVFNPKTDKKTKIEFLFKIYDVDQDGYISNGELFTVLKSMVGNNLTETQLQQIVDKTILENDMDKDGKLSFDEFSKAMGDELNIHSKMNVEFPSTEPERFLPKAESEEDNTSSESEEES